MIRSRTLRAAARMLLGTLIAAYAMVSLHATARAPQMPDESGSGIHMAMAVNAQPAAEEHCNESATDTTALMCKYHCQSVAQTLDHPDASVHPAADAAYLVVALADVHAGHGASNLPASRPHAAHHGGAPPPYQSTARLRI
jgi:hypothetical protein